MAALGIRTIYQHRSTSRDHFRADCAAVSVVIHLWAPVQSGLLLTSAAIMALLQYRAPVDYEAQREAFRDFLENFKSSQSKSEEAAADAIDDLNLEEDRTSDEYDFMDDVAEGDGSASRRAGRSKPLKRKYMSILQEVADRERSSILIELDDLEEVRLMIAALVMPHLIPASSMRKRWETNRI